MCAVTSLSQNISDLWSLNCYLNPYGLYNYLVISPGETNRKKKKNNSVLPSLDIVGNFKRDCFENLFILCAENLQIAFNIFQGSESVLKAANKMSSQSH